MLNISDYLVRNLSHNLKSINLNKWWESGRYNKNTENFGCPAVKTGLVENTVSKFA